MAKTAQNKNLHKARSSKKDEFYTQLTDIENELRHYKHHFAKQVVYCNCDDPRVSNFFHYFSHNFAHLKLKKLITTCYKNQNPDLLSESKTEKAIYIEYKRDAAGRLIPYPKYMQSIAQKCLYQGYKDNPNMPHPEDIGIGYLQGDGDFRSDEAIALLKQADIVVTNPPFSLFREYVAQLVEHDKKFLILGDQNAITYKEIFKLIKENKIWLGVHNGGIKWFEVKGDYDIKTESRKKVVNGRKYFSAGRINWYTNLDIAKRHEDLILYKTWKDNKAEYLKYDNYNAIEVKRVEYIPEGYAGAMGVPITFLDKYNQEQFEILGNEYDLNIDKGRGYIKGKRMYSRIFIKNKKL